MAVARVDVVAMDAREQRGDARRGVRPSEQEALSLVATARTKHLQLSLGFDALADHAESESVRHRDAGTHDRATGVTAVKLADERAVDLHLVDRKLVEPAE